MSSFVCQLIFLALYRREQSVMGNAMTSCCQEEDSSVSYNDQDQYDALPDASLIAAQTSKSNQHKIANLEGQLSAMKLRLDVLEKRNRFKDLLEDTQLRSYRLPNEKLFVHPVYKPPEHPLITVEMTSPINDQIKDT